MAAAPTSATGIDIGHHSVKAVSLSRKGKGKIVVSGYSNVLVDGELKTAEDLGHCLRQIIKRAGPPTKAIGIAITARDSLIRNIEQPDTPLPILAEALRLNGRNLLDQDLKGITLDCSLNEQIVPAREGEGDAKGSGFGSGSGSSDTQRRKTRKYLVAGLPGTTIDLVWNAGLKERLPIKSLQLGPLAIFNAFEFAEPEIFSTTAFVLVDIGHVETNLMVGCKGELVLVRSVDYCGQGMANYLAADGTHTPETAMRLLMQGDPAVMEMAETYISGLAREVTNSVGYYESLRDDSISKVYLSGGMAASQQLLQTLVGYVDVSCELWNPLQRCDVNLPKKITEAYEADFINLAAATGAALDQLRTTA